ncbi:low affinity Fe/Cu permease [Chryseobacterium vietnamense]|uniref:Low affinity Fe/Cu permease n=1 Tax=Chryseobacterium vietnamense TaxID=866785 RepID=A0ACC6J2A9_9FLAO|nr:low affinity iron permease family protein [Chryseobacterium vietnamense]MDR6456983.1 low affinity Fe/Cu permease [Chryseobacterium vietnamense]
MIKDILNRWQDWPVYIKGSAFLGIAGLTVFFIRNAQNKDIKALQDKLDELTAASKGSYTIKEIENLTDDEMKQLHAFYKDLEKQRREKNIPDNDRPENKHMAYHRYK